jgi:hypothetical protein
VSTSSTVDVEALNALLTEHRPNVVTEGADDTWQTRVKCDGRDCEFYFQSPGVRRDPTGYFTTVAAHTEHLTDVVAEFMTTDREVLASTATASAQDVAPRPLTSDEVASLRAEHRSSYPMGNIHHGTETNPDWGTFCVECAESWPCTTSRLVATLDDTERRESRYAEMLAACPQGHDGHACCDCPAPSEQDLRDQITAIAAGWSCNCGGPSPEGQHEMHCDSYYGDRLRNLLRLGDDLGLRTRDARIARDALTAYADAIAENLAASEWDGATIANDAREWAREHHG